MTRGAPTGEIEALTSIRGIAAWWVVAFHARSLLAPSTEWAKVALSKGYLAVDMFFVLSGFVIYLNYVARLAPTRAAIADFFIRRFARIYPLHLLVLLGAGAFALAVWWRTGHLPTGSPPREFWLSLILVQAWGFTDPLTWNVPAWSISTEFAAYLLFPILPLVLRVRAWSTAALIFAVALLIISLHAVFVAQGGNNLNWNLPRNAVLRCLVEFGSGALLCEIFLRLRGGGNWISPVLLGVALVTATLVAGFGLPETLGMPIVWVTLISGVALWPKAWPNPLRWRPLVYIGDVSYATYLSHYMILVVFKLLFVGPDREVANWALALFFAIVALASVILYHGFERPAQRWIMARWRAWTGNARAVASPLRSADT